MATYFVIHAVQLLQNYMNIMILSLCFLLFAHSIPFGNPNHPSFFPPKHDADTSTYIIAIGLHFN